MSVIKSKKFVFSTGKKFKANIEFYNSAQEVVDDCKTRKNTSSSFHDYSKESVKEDWHGVKTYEEALELLRTGYQPTVDAFKNVKFKSSGNGKRISFQNNIAGFAPVVPLALKGVPNSMINMTMKPIKCKVIDVYYDMTVNCSTSTETIIENGQMILGAIKELENQGYRFNLYAVQSYSESSDADVLCIKVKSSDKPLDLKRISFPLTHPAFFRVIGFDWYGKCPVATYRCAYGRGMGYELSDTELKEFAKQAFGDNAIYMSAGKYLGDKNHVMEVLANDK